MNYQEAYNYLLSLGNISGREYLKDLRHCVIYLERLQKLLYILGNPEKKIPHYIHVTGTSGKGSVCLMLDAILRADQRKVGVLTSPSPDGLLGRAAVGGKAMNKKEFAELMEKIKAALEIFIHKTNLEIPSQFEILTAMALLYFADKKIDWAIIEVGLGGRFDSTNVIPRKDVAVITNIGLDHTDVLGNSKIKIAYEKTGIIKPRCAVFTSETDKKILKIIAKACRLNKVKLFQTIENAKLNSAVCVAVSRHLGINENTIARGIKKTKLPIRLEIISQKPLIILDGAHNEDKMKTTTAAVKKIMGEKKITDINLLVGFAANKDIDTMTKQLAELQPKNIACTRFTQNFSRKTADPRDLRQQLKKLLRRSNIEIFLDPKTAMEWIRQKQKAGDILLVTGSMYLAGELRESFKLSP